MSNPEEAALSKLYHLRIRNTDSTLLTVVFEVTGMVAEVEPGQLCEAIFDPAYAEFRPESIEYGKNSLTLWSAYPTEIYLETSEGRVQLQ